MGDSIGSNMENSQPKKEIQAQVPEYLKAIGMDPRRFWPKKYRFTREPIPGKLNPLSTSQRNFYEANGFIVLDETVSPKLIEALRDQYHNNWRASPIGPVQSRSITPTNVVETGLLNKFVTSANLLPYVGCFTDEQILLMTTSLVNCFKVHHQTARSGAQMDGKQSEKDKRVDSYDDLWSNASNNTNNTDNKDGQQQATLLAASGQDVETPANWAATFENAGYQFLYRDWMYLPFRPIDKIVCTVTALEPIDQVLLVVPGTHKVGQCTITTTASDSQQEDGAKMNEVFESAPPNMRTLVESAKKQSKYINLKPGQTLFFNPGLIHGYSNDLINSKKEYLAVVSYYASGDCKYIDYGPSRDLLNHSTLPIPVGLADFGDNNPADYKSWLGKVRLVRDIPMNL